MAYGRRGSHYVASDNATISATNAAYVIPRTIVFLFWNPDDPPRPPKFNAITWRTFHVPRLPPLLRVHHALPNSTSWRLCRRPPRFKPCLLALTCWERSNSLLDRVAIHPEHVLV